MQKARPTSFHLYYPCQDFNDFLFLTKMLYFLFLL